MSASPHVRDQIDDLIAGRLDRSAAQSVEPHLAICDTCRREWNALRKTRDALRGSFAETELPPQLRDRVLQALDQNAIRTVPATRIWWAAAAAAVMIALLMLLARRPRPVGVSPPADLAAASMSDFTAVRFSTLPLEIRSENPAEVEAFFTRAGLSFDARVFDLGMMGYRLEGGRVHRIGGQPSALFVYRNAEGRLLVCQMFEGSEASLPSGSAIRMHDGIRFHRYQRGGTTAVFWPEGSVLCVLTGDAGPQEVLDLAYAKAMKRIASIKQERPPIGGLL